MNLEREPRRPPASDIISSPAAPAVLIVSYRRADLLQSCLNSVARHLPESPIRVWDNASDGTPAVRDLAASTRGVEWTFCPTNVGFGAAVNGLALQSNVSDGRPLLLLNPDAELLGDLARSRAALTGDVAVVSPTVVSPTGDRPTWDVARRKQNAVRAAVSHLGYSARLRGTPLSDLYRARPTEVDGYLTGCCLLVARKAWDELGGFDERFFVYAEEAELQRRARAAGWRLRLIDEPHVRHGALGTVSDSTTASRRSADLLRNHQALLLGAGNTGSGARFLAATALLERVQRSKKGLRKAPEGSAEMPHVVLTTNDLRRGGAERQRILLAGELTSRGYPVTIVCLQDLGPLQRELDPRVRLVLSPWWQPWPQGLYTQDRPTVIITGVTDTEAGFALGLTRTRRGPRKPVWLAASHSARPGRTYSSRLAAAVRRADGLIALSQAHLAELTAHQVLATPTWLAPNGVPKPANLDRPPLSSPLRLGMLCRLVEQKNPHKLVAALAPLAGGHWTLDVFGDGPDRARLEALTPPELTDQVRWRGWSPGPDEALPQIDVLCAPSELEAFPLVIIEAMAAGLPVIAAGVCAVPEILDHGRAGVVIGPGDAAGWTAALREAIDDPGSLAKRAVVGHARQQHLYTIEAMADGYVTAINEALEASTAAAEHR